MPEPQTDLNATLQRLFGILSRRRWWIILPAIMVALGTIGALKFLPKRYQSEASLEIVQQIVSQRYVLATDTANATDVVQAMKREVLSRTRLLGIIDEFGLYPKQRNRMGPEALADMMRKDVEVEPLDQIPGRSEFSSFRVSFTVGSPGLAQAVTSRLTSLFIEERLKTEENRAATTTKFLEDQLEIAKKQLAAQQQRRRDFQTQYIGELPQQQQANFVAVTELRTQLQNTENRIVQSEQQSASLELSLNEKLTRLRVERTALLNRFTQRHPEVIKKDDEIARMTALLEGLKTGLADKPTSSSLPPSDDPTVVTLATQVQANQAERANLGKEESRLKAEIARYQGQLNLVPIHEQQLSDILREYDVYAQHVKELETELLQAQQVTSVAERQEGQQFRLVDAPTLPISPSSPKRVKIALGGLGAGLVLGIALALLLEMRDTAFHDETVVAQRFKLPLVLGIPLLLTPAEERSRRWRRALEWCAGSLLFLVIAGAEFFVYRHS